jgi:hypothetical protein
VSGDKGDGTNAASLVIGEDPLEPKMEEDARLMSGQSN